MTLMPIANLHAGSIRRGQYAGIAGTVRADLHSWSNLLRISGELMVLSGPIGF